MDRIEVVHHDDTVTRFENVTYCAWNEQGRRGVTVYRNVEELARLEDVFTVNAYRGTQLAAAM